MHFFGTYAREINSPACLLGLVVDVLDYFAIDLGFDLILNISYVLVFAF